MPRSSLSSSFVVSVGLITLSTNSIHAQGDAVDSKRADYRTLFEGMRDARLQLTSGIYSGKGHRILRDDGKEVLEGDFSFYCAFDYLNNRVRWLREDPYVTTNPTTGKDTVQLSKYLLVRTPKKTMLIEEMDVAPLDDLHVYPPDHDPQPAARPFDVRTFGFADFASVDDGATFEEMSKHLDEWSVVGARTEPDGRCVVSFAPQEQVRMDIWINSKRGYTIERYEMRALDKTTGKLSSIMMFADVEWTEREGVWLPTSINLERDFGGRETFHAKLDWESVNQEPAAELFEPDNLGIKKGGNIVDLRLGDKPVVIGRIGEARERVLDQPRRGFRIWLVMGGVIIVIAALIGVYFWRGGPS